MSTVGLNLPRPCSWYLRTHALPVWCFQQSHRDVGLGSHTQFCQRVASSFLCPWCLMLVANPVNKINLSCHSKTLSNNKSTFYKSNSKTRKQSSPWEQNGPAKWTLLFQLGATVKKSPWHLKIPQPRQGHNPSQSSARVSLRSDSTLSQNLLFPTCPWRTILTPSAAFCRASASSSIL